MENCASQFEEFYKELVMSLDGGQRIQLAALFFDAERKRILDSLPTNLTHYARVRLFYERVYGEPLPADFPTDRAQL